MPRQSLTVAQHTVVSKDHTQRKQVGRSALHLWMAKQWEKDLMEVYLHSIQDHWQLSNKAIEVKPFVRNGGTPKAQQLMGLILLHTMHSRIRIRNCTLKRRKWDHPMAMRLYSGQAA